MPEDPAGSAADPQRSARVYGGMTAEQRTARRRRALIDAADHLIGHQGYPAATVRAICQQAGVSERYFYESFTGRDEILSVVYADVVRDARARVLESFARLGPGAGTEQVLRAGFGTIVEFAVEDPRRANVLFVDGFGVTTDRQVTEISADTSFSRLVHAVTLLLTGGRDHPALRFAAIGMIGFASRALAAWARGGITDTPEQIIDACVLVSAATIERVCDELGVRPVTIDDPAALVRSLG